MGHHVPVGDEEDDADAYPVWLRLQGVRLDPKLANGAIFRVVIGWGHFLAPNPLKSPPTLCPKANTNSSIGAELASPQGGDCDAGGLRVRLAPTPGGSTGSDASKQGYFSRCHRVGRGHFLAPNPLKSSPTPLRQTRSARGLNGITFPLANEEDDADVCRFGFRLQGVRLDSEATRPMGLVPGVGPGGCSRRNDLTGRWCPAIRKWPRRF